MNNLKIFISTTTLFFLIVTLPVSQIACKEKREPSSRLTELSPKEAILDFLKLVVVKKDYKKAYNRYTNKAESYKEFYEIEKNMFSDVKTYKIIQEKGPKKRTEIRQFTVALKNTEGQSRVIYMLATKFVGGNEVETGMTPFADINE